MTKQWLNVTIKGKTFGIHYFPNRAFPWVVLTANAITLRAGIGRTMVEAIADCPHDAIR